MARIKKLIFTLLLIFLFFSLVPNIINYKNKITFYRQIKKQLAEEEKKQIELKTEIVKKKSSDEVEKTIRNKLNLLKENEVAFIIPSPTKIPKKTPTPIISNWKQWRRVFFNF